MIHLLLVIAMRIQLLTAFGRHHCVPIPLASIEGHPSINKILDKDCFVVVPRSIVIRIRHHLIQTAVLQIKLHICCSASEPGWNMHQVTWQLQLFASPSSSTWTSSSIRHCLPGTLPFLKQLVIPMDSCTTIQNPIRYPLVDTLVKQFGLPFMPQAIQSGSFSSVASYRTKSRCKSGCWSWKLHRWLIGPCKVITIRVAQ